MLDGAERMESEGMLLFLHIPKTGGTTINRLLRLKYAPKRELVASILGRGQGADWRTVVEEFGRMPPEDIRRVRHLPARHFSYGIHEHLPVEGRYITVLREPVDRVVSSYYYTRRADPDNDISIEEFVQGGRGTGWLIGGLTDNVQVRMLAGESGVPVLVPIGQCTRQMLDVAKRRVQSEFLLTGLTESMDETVLLLQQRLGWRRANYVTSNVNTARPRKLIPESQRDFILSHNQLDLELYQFAKALFAQEIEEAGPSFPAQLERFRKRNRRYNATLQPFYRAYSNALARRASKQSD